MTVEALQTICVLQGETFQTGGQIQSDDEGPIDISDMVISCQLKTLKNKLVCDLIIQVVDATQGKFIIRPTSTIDWPLGSGNFFDFKVTKGWQVRFTYRVQINVVETITR